VYGGRYDPSATRFLQSVQHRRIPAHVECQQLLASRATRYVFRVEDGHLLGCQRGTLQVGHQPVDAAGDVAQMKSQRPKSMRRGPDLSGGEPLQTATQVFARLLEAEEHRSDQRAHALDLSAEPGFRLRFHFSILPSGGNGPWWERPLACYV
jgi:hypothetical protein